MAAVGAAPGDQITSSGVTFPWPSSAIGTPDNTAAGGQRIDLSDEGSTLGILMAATYGPASGTWQVVYGDGLYQSFTVTAPDWFSGTAPTGDQLAVTASYQNGQGNTRYQHPAYIYSTADTAPAGKGRSTGDTAGSERRRQRRHLGPAHLGPGSWRVTR